MCGWFFMLRPQRLKTSLCSKNVLQESYSTDWHLAVFRRNKFVLLVRLKFLLETYFCNFIYVSGSRTLTRKRIKILFRRMTQVAASTQISFSTLLQTISDEIYCLVSIDVQVICLRNFLKRTSNVLNWS